jgi:tRNA (mo5U34)-methyltransferase
MLDDWIRNSVRGKHVLDMFSANGGFSLIAALAGAREVVGVEFSEERIRCAEFVASTVQRELDCRITFRHADVYNIASIFHEPFDVVLCFGGLYHIADPPYVLKQVARLTRERLLLQTSQVLPIPGSWARFNVRRLDKTAEGMTSLRAGYGTWECSPGCLREVLLHAGFKVVAERVPSILLRRRFPWYMANCEPQ